MNIKCLDNKIYDLSNLSSLFVKDGAKLSALEFLFLTLIFFFLIFAIEAISSIPNFFSYIMIFLYFYIIFKPKKMYLILNFKIQEDVLQKENQCILFKTTNPQKMEHKINEFFSDHNIDKTQLKNKSLKLKSYINNK